MSDVLFTVPVTLIKRGTVSGEDEVGDPVYSPPSELEVSGWVERAGSTEDLDHRDQITSLYLLWLDGHVDLSGVDSVRYGPHTYTIEGEPGFQPGGFVVGSYTFVNLRRVTG